MKSSTLVRSLVATGIFVVASHAALAQGPKAGSVDVAAGGGYSYLNTNDEGSANTYGKGHGVFNASVSYNVVKLISVGFEYTFVPLDNEVVDGTKFTERLNNYGAVARFGLLRNHFVVPYVLAAAGGLRLNDKATEGNQSASLSQSGGYFGVGAGANAYLGHGFGVRPEFRYERQSLDDSTFEGVSIKGDSRNEILATVSLFYQFGGRGR